MEEEDVEEDEPVKAANGKLVFLVLMRCVIISYCTIKTMKFQRICVELVLVSNSTQVENSSIILYFLHSLLLFLIILYLLECVLQLFLKKSKRNPKILTLLVQLCLGILIVVIPILLYLIIIRQKVSVENFSVNRYIFLF
eukprot:TRINITY_DN9587_c0_g1_i2.p2 TRINITY_DN9587_c0_g1~~TRINITY_DN9587_c0_g1_i2.p2  ORF type:complete len:140 (-),score=6.40 TRINITY_DN9587_c0_g1_i2:152-571(-)